MITAKSAVSPGCVGTGWAASYVHLIARRIVKVVLLHLVFERLTCLILLHVEYLMHIGQKFAILLSRTLPIDALTELLDGSTFL